MDDKILENIDKQLHQLVKISALTLSKDLTLTDAIYRLYKVGFSPKEIADILGTNSNVVNVRLSEMRKREVKKNG